MDYKSQTRQYYDGYGANFGKDKHGDYEKFVKKHLFEDVKLFIDNLKGEDILDLGSGPGRDALFFKERGLKPVCVDISPEMAKVCREKGLEAVVMDMENLAFSNESFDGVWAYASLLHVPKIIIRSVLDNIYRVLRSEGVFYVGMKEGDFQGFIPNQLVPIYCKFMALYSDEEFRKFLDEKFEILNFSKTEADEYNTYLNYLCRKKLS